MRFTPWLVAVGAQALVLAGVSEASEDQARPVPDVDVTAKAAPPAPTTLTIKAKSQRTRIRPGLLGVNHNYIGNGFGVWSPKHDRPQPGVVAGMKRAGITQVRYPGGTQANLFRWEKAIGRKHGCQVNGKTQGRGYSPVKGVGYGPDEHMMLMEQTGATPVLMVQSITETPRGAANWVEYMNAPAGAPGNPNGGVDWADERAANGHPEPYGVKRWEVGNEQRYPRQRYWMSDVQHQALLQYANGGSATIADEALGKACQHPPEGVPSDGTSHQTFSALYPPIDSQRLSVTVDGEPWTRVTTLEAAGPTDKVYVVDTGTGEISFGNGTRGAVPPAGTTVRASYRSVHEGAFAFIKAMKRVDPSIDVCTSWGKSTFVKVARPRKYDCATAHTYTFFDAEGHGSWRNPAEGYGWHMLGTGTEERIIDELERSLPRRSKLPITEFGTIRGDHGTWPTYAASMANAVYISSMLIVMQRQGVPWATGSALVTPTTRGILGPKPHFNVSAEALARQAVAPLFGSGGRSVPVKIKRNPMRDPRLDAGSYPALVALAARTRDGHLYVMVVNRLPGKRDHVQAQIALRGFRSDGRVHVRAVRSASYKSANLPGRPQHVRLLTQARDSRPGGMTFRFPPHSVTLLRFDRS